MFIFNLKNIYPNEKHFKELVYILWVLKNHVFLYSLIIS